MRIKRVNEDSGAQTVAGWATSISAGPPDEHAQSLSFEVMSNSNPALFAVAPAITANGVRAVSTGLLLGMDTVRRFGVLPGDLDGNGVVTAIEASTVRRNVGKRYPNPVAADVDGDGVVSMADYNIARANIGRRV